MIVATALVLMMTIPGLALFYSGMVRKKNVLATMAQSLAAVRRAVAGHLIGLIAGSLCYWACTSLKLRFDYDDSLDVFGVHGIGGMTGTLLTGVFATAAIGGTSGLIEGNPQQLLIQLYGVAVTLVWSAGVTYVLLRLVGAFVPLRVSREHEMEGLDISQHGEALQ
jgi:Amt family ammonium transporter